MLQFSLADTAIDSRVPTYNVARWSALCLVSLACLACDALREDAPRPRHEARTHAAPVEIFVTDWCPYCRQLEAFLRERDVAYVRYDIERDERAAMEHRKLSDGGIPVTRIGSQVVLGFRPDVISKLLQLEPVP